MIIKNEYFKLILYNLKKMTLKQKLDEDFLNRINDNKILNFEQQNGEYKYFNIFLKIVENNDLFNEYCDFLNENKNETITIEMIEMNPKLNNLNTLDLYYLYLSFKKSILNNIDFNELFLERIEIYIPTIYFTLINAVSNKNYYTFYDTLNNSKIPWFFLCQVDDIQMYNIHEITLFKMIEKKLIKKNG